MGDRQSAIDFYNQGVTAANDRSQTSHLQHAYQLFSSAVLIDPSFGQGWYQRGNNNSDLNCLPAAVADWRRALECENSDEERAKIFVNIGWRLHSLGRTDEAFEASNEAIRLKPDLALGYLNLSLIYQRMFKNAEAVKFARKAYALAPEDIHTPIALAFALLFDGQYAEGLALFENRFKWRLHNFLHYPYPKWDGSEGKTLFLVADQGLGDTLSYARFVEAAAKRSKYVHAVVQPELMRAFSHAFMHLPNLNLIPAPSPFLQADAWSTFVSLPAHLGLTDAEIVKQRGIEMPQFSLPNTWKIPDRKFHIGVAWAGSPLNDIDKDRNIPVTQFLELYQVPGIQLYSLQVDDKAKELHDAGCSALIRDLKPYIRDVCDTVSLLKELDLVITVESALGHICAAAGKECWIPYSYRGKDYRLGLQGEKKLWTPKHRVFCQDQAATWDKPFSEIIQALQKRIV